MICSYYKIFVEFIWLFDCSMINKELKYEIIMFVSKCVIIVIINLLYMVGWE